MSNILLINAHQPYAFSPGRLNASLVEIAIDVLQAKGCDLRCVKSAEGYDIDEEIENHRWADIVIVQSPVNWMGVPWSFKKYIDEVYSAGSDNGLMCRGDGRHRSDPEKGYGAGGVLQGKRYMLSLTLNAPRGAFNDPDEYLFQGHNIDDLFYPQHMNFRFFAMEPLPTFVCYDVIKNPKTDEDFTRFKQHLNQYIS